MLFSSITGPPRTHGIQTELLFISQDFQLYFRSAVFRHYSFCVLTKSSRLRNNCARNCYLDGSTG